MNGREGELENAPGDVALVSNDADDPWISEFRQKSSTLLDQLCATSLIEHIQYFIRNVNTSVNDCYVKPSKAGKLKEVIKEALLLFSCLYNCEPLKNLSTEEECMKYMEYMSDLLAMYIDMELKASRRGRDLPARITSRIVTSLCIYLNYSEEYMLETLMKIRFMHNLYQHILDPLVSKIFKIIPNPNSGTMYVRHLLLYRLWKKISDKNTKNDINSDASIKLGLPPTDIPAFFLEEVLPRGPILTKFYLMQKFDVKKSSDLFLQFCRKSRGFTNADEVQHIIEEQWPNSRIEGQRLQFASSTKERNYDAMPST